MLKILLMIINLQLGYYQQDIERTQYGVWQECVIQSCFFPEITTQIATCETQCGTTGVGKTKNNIFGFRKTKEYMSFTSLRSCIQYYKSWEDKYYPEHLFSYHQPKGTLCDYYCFIESKGWKMGKPFSPAERKYTNYLRRINLSFE